MREVHERTKEQPREGKRGVRKVPIIVSQFKELAVRTNFGETPGDLREILHINPAQERQTKKTAEDLAPVTDEGGKTAFYDEVWILDISMCQKNINISKLIPNS